MSDSFDPLALDRGWNWFRFRGLVLVLVFTMGFVALSTGVGVSDRPGVTQADFMTRVYYTLGLFVLGGLDLGVPRGGPSWARLLLWAAYFGAPAITTSALVETALRVLRPNLFRLWRIRDHVIIAGCGRLAVLYLQRLRETDNRQSVVVVDNRTENPNLRVALENYRAHIVFGDITNIAILESLRLPHAESVVLLTGDDYVNLNTASRIGQMAPHLVSRTLIHISDIELLRVIESSGILHQATRFNAYRRAARHLVQHQLLPHFSQTRPSDTVVLAGFGRFGQTVLDELQEQASGQFSKVILVDLQANLLSTVFSEQVGFHDGYHYELLDDDLRHPRTWLHIEELIGGTESEPVFVLGSGDEGVNIRTALWLTKKFPDAKIVARCFHHSPFTQEISAECGFDIVSTSELLLASMHPQWFHGPARDEAPS